MWDVLLQKQAAPCVQSYLNKAMPLLQKSNEKFRENILVQFTNSKDHIHDFQTLVSYSAGA